MDCRSECAECCSCCTMVANSGFDAASAARHRCSRRSVMEMRSVSSAMAAWMVPNDCASRSKAATLLFDPASPARSSHTKHTDDHKCKMRKTEDACPHTTLRINNSSFVPLANLPQHVTHAAAPDQRDDQRHKQDTENGDQTLDGSWTHQTRSRTTSIPGPRP